MKRIRSNVPSWAWPRRKQQTAHQVSPAADDSSKIPIDVNVEGNNESEGSRDDDNHQDQLQQNDSDADQSHSTPLSSTSIALQTMSESPAAKWRRRRILAVYLLTSTILYADLALMAPNLSAIAEEFGFDDDERDVKLGGMIALAFFLVGAPVALLIGWLADFVNRSPLYAITVFLGEAACLGTYFVRTYQQLFVTRTLTGISIGGAMPVIFSVLGDLYPAEQRNAVAAIVTIGTGLGTGLGQALAGFLGPKYGWRFPFLVVSIPGMICSLLLLLIKDPKRGQQERARIEIDEAMQRRQGGPSLNEEESIEEDLSEEEEEIILNEGSCERIPEGPEYSEHKVLASTETSANEKASWKTAWEMIKTPSVALIFLQAAPSALPFGFASVFLNDYLAEDRGMTVEAATGVLITFGAGNAIGVCLAGFLGTYTYKRDVRYPTLVMGTSLLLSCVPMYLLINSVNSTSDLSLVASLGLVTGALAVIPVPIERAILTNVTIPEARGRANSILGIIDDLGKGLGPAIVSVLIQAFDRPTAFNISLLGWVVGGLISYCVFFFVKKDEELTQERVRRAIVHEESLGIGLVSSTENAEPVAVAAI